MAKRQKEIGSFTLGIPILFVNWNRRRKNNVIKSNKTSFENLIKIWREKKKKVKPFFKNSPNIAYDTQVVA